MQSKVNRTLIVMLPLVCAIAALLTLAHRSAQQGSSAVLGPGRSSRIGVRGAAESPVALHGEEAITLLKQEDTYDSLAGAVAIATYSVNRVNRINRINRAPLPNGEGAYEALNPAQSLRTVFTNDGVRVHSSGASKWQVGLRLKGYGYGEQLRHVASGKMKTQGNRVEISKHVVREARPTSLVEWYVNKPEGLEQGFTLSAPPVMSSKRDALTPKPLRLTMAVTSNLRGVRGLPAPKSFSLEPLGTRSFPYFYSAASLLLTKPI